MIQFLGLQVKEKFLPEKSQEAFLYPLSRSHANALYGSIGKLPEADYLACNRGGNFCPLAHNNILFLNSGV